MLHITPSSRPAFQPDTIEDRIRELREIAKPIVQHYQSDLGHDEKALREHPHVKEWLWAPYESGTHIASLNPRGKKWAQAILEHCQTAYPQTPTPYLITPQGVTATTWERVKALVERLPTPTYEVSSEGKELVTTHDWYFALRKFEYHRGPATLRETSEPKPLLERDKAPERRVAAA